MIHISNYFKCKWIKCTNQRHRLVKVKVKSLSCVWLFGTPWTVAHQAPLSMGFSRQEYWSGLPFPSPGIEPRSPTLQVDSSPSEPPGKPNLVLHYLSEFAQIDVYVSITCYICIIIHGITLNIFHRSKAVVFIFALIWLMKQKYLDNKSQLSSKILLFHYFYYP